MKEAWPQTAPTPEEQLGAIQDFINLTTGALATQLTYLEYMRNCPAIFSKSRIELLEQNIEKSVAENVAALNQWNEAQPGLHIVHENLPGPAKVITFLGFNPASRTYGAGVAIHENQKFIWPIVAGSELQLAESN